MENSHTSHWIDGRFPTPPPKIAAAIFLGFLGLVLAFAFLQGSELGDRIPWPLTILGAVLGYLLGFWCAAGMISETDEAIGVRKSLGFFVLPVLSIFCGTLLMRTVFLGAAFIGVESPTKMTKAVVVGVDYTRRTWLPDYLEAELSKDSREFQVLASPQLIEIAGVRHGSPRLCVLLPVQTGRWGYRRIVGPNAFDEPVGMSAVIDCD